MKNDKILVLKNIFYNIEQFDDGTSGYSIAKRTIKELFKNTNGKSFDHIYSRLVVIDSLYSTQMGRRYYGLEELANNIFLLNKQCDTRELFVKLAQNPNIDNFDKFNCDDKLNLFEKKYGINKGGKKIAKAISLITKYAYFETDQNFPIYDSIIKEVYPIICVSCRFDEIIECIKTLDNIICYVNKINILKNKLSELFEMEISYDKLDMVLWHIGKINRKHFSLVLSMSDFMIFAADNNESDLLNNISKTDCYKDNIAMRLILDFLSV